MTARWTKILLIAALALALPPGATLAACLQAGPASCCCSDTGCPEPGEARVERDSCCKMSDSAPAPATKPATVAPAPSKPLDEAIEGFDTAVAAVPVVETVQEVRPTGVPKPVPLFTLHAALLI